MFPSEQSQFALARVVDAPRLYLLGDVLVVADNSECGGMNVRFNGVYRRAGKG